MRKCLSKQVVCRNYLNLVYKVFLFCFVLLRTDTFSQTVSGESRCFEYDTQICFHRKASTKPFDTLENTIENLQEVKTTPESKVSSMEKLRRCIDILLTQTSSRDGENIALPQHSNEEYLFRSVRVRFNFLKSSPRSKF